MEARIVAKSSVDRTLLSDILAIDSRATIQETLSGLGAEREVHLDHLFVTIAVIGFQAMLEPRPATLRIKFYSRRGVWLITGSQAEFREMVYHYILNKSASNDLYTQLSREVYNLFISDTDLKPIFSRVRREDRPDGFNLVAKS